MSEKKLQLQRTVISAMASTSPHGFEWVDDKPTLYQSGKGWKILKALGMLCRFKEGKWIPISTEHPYPTRVVFYEYGKVPKSVQNEVAQYVACFDVFHEFSLETVREETNKKEERTILQQIGWQINHHATKAETSHNKLAENSLKNAKHFLDKLLSCGELVNSEAMEQIVLDAFSLGRLYERGVQQQSISTFTRGLIMNPNNATKARKGGRRHTASICRELVLEKWDNWIPETVSGERTVADFILHLQDEADTVDWPKEHEALYYDGDADTFSLKGDLSGKEKFQSRTVYRWLAKK